MQLELSWELSKYWWFEVVCANNWEIEKEMFLPWRKSLIELEFVKKLAIYVSFKQRKIPSNAIIWSIISPDGINQAQMVYIDYE